MGFCCIAGNEGWVQVDLEARVEYGLKVVGDVWVERGGDGGCRRWVVCACERL
jgi:hypothetical protein